MHRKSRNGIHICSVQAELASLLGALAALYVPLEMREAVKEKATKVDFLGCD